MSVGQIARLNLDFLNWEDDFGRPSQKKTTGSKKTKEKPIIYPIFTKLAEETDSAYWKRIFEGFSKGIMPDGFKMCGNFLRYTMNAKKLTEINLETEPVDECIMFLKKHGSFDSGVEGSSDVFIINTWSDAKNNAIKEKLVDIYVKTMKNVMNLSERAETSLRNVINFGIVYGYFCKNTIEMQDSKIYRINGLIYDDKLELFGIDSNLKPKITRSSKTTKTKKTNDHIYKSYRSFITDVLGYTSVSESHYNEEDEENDD